MKNFSVQLFEMASVTIAASLSGLLHPHQAGPLYTDDQIVTIATARALKLAKAIDALEEAEAQAALPITAPATAPTDDALAKLADDAAQATIDAELASLKPPVVVAPPSTATPPSDTTVASPSDPTAPATPNAKR